MTRRHLLGTVPIGLATLTRAADTPPDIHPVPPDLSTPQVTPGAPTRGMRVRQSLPAYSSTDVHHALYLPLDWQPGKKYPVIVEYPGNGPYTSPDGDFSSGEIEGCNLGYGITAGRGFLWISMPFINQARNGNQLWWWGDADATADYCIETVRTVCETYGGDPAWVFLAGFSRGAIACNYIGLRNDRIADVWAGFIACSHYDGVRLWDYEGSGRPSALTRLQRLKGRACFISHEGSTKDVHDYLESTGVAAPLTIQTIHYRNHTNTWVLRDIPERHAVRNWLHQVLRNRPGLHTLSGKVIRKSGGACKGARIESGAHWTFSDPNGKFVLGGLIDSDRRVLAKLASAESSEKDVSIQGRDVQNIVLELG